MLERGNFVLSVPAAPVLWLCMPTHSIEGLVSIGSYESNGTQPVPRNYLDSECRHD